MTLARNSQFGINVDFEKSHDSYIFDKTTNREILDFFGMYASLPLGYNHSIFKTERFKKEYLMASTFKINNCEFVSDQTIEFDKKFTKFAGKGIYQNFHYTCTGALAVESAIKVCLDYKNYHFPKIISFNNSFHGINSYSSFITSRFPGSKERLEGLPQIFSLNLEMDLGRVEDELKKGDVTCVLVEPIQCSAGDLYQDETFFKKLRKLCTAYDVPLIFDEIQIGFGGTGKLWFFEHLDIEPDIVVFGKKTQLSGIMVKQRYSKIFEPPRSKRIEVTWDGDLSDMIRCKYVIEAYEKYDILKNVEKQSKTIVTKLSSLNNIQNLRNCGLIIGFDLKSNEERDTIVQRLFENGLICNRAGSNSIRLRPSLNINSDEVEESIKIFKKVIK